MWRILVLSQRYFGTFLTEHQGKPYNAECCGGRFASSEVEDIRRILDPADRIICSISYTLRWLSSH
jgi:hypothetical protein